MKPTAFIALAAVLPIAGFVPRLAAQDTPYELQKSYDHNTPLVSVSDPVPWSVIGQWHYASDTWRGMIDIRADGTFSRVGDTQGGKWKLGGEQDNFVLVLSWKNLPQDTVALISPVEFRSEAKGEVIVRRLPVVSQAAPPAVPVPHFNKSSLSKEQLAACAAFKAKAGATSRLAEYQQLEGLGIFPDFSAAQKSSGRADLVMNPPSFIMTPAQLIDLLGQPDSTGENSLFYDLGGGGGRATAVGIRIRDSHVAERWSVTTKS